MTRFAIPRRGFTLIELLVVMAIITALAALALVIAPGIMQKDNTLRGTSDVQTAMKVAQGMAAAAKLPRGVRLIAPQAGFTAAGANLNCVTELQYLEVPPILLPDPQALVATSTNPQGVNGPRVDFVYGLDPAGTGAIKSRQCLLYNLNGDQIQQITANTTLTLPTLGFFSRILSTRGGPGGSLEVILDVYPDAFLGGATAFRTYHFGIYGSPRPLLGEPTIQLPRDICVDLTLCWPFALPMGNNAGGGPPWQNYDIVFAPSGQLLPSAGRAGGSQIFLWVRDYTKVTNMQIVSRAPWQMVPQQFRAGGEQQIVGLRGASVGTAPVKWPDDMVNGPYAGGTDPYTFARAKLTGSGQ